MKWLLFLYPWLELWSLIELGSQTSAATAMLWVLGAGVLGIALFRLAGRQTLAHMQQAQRVAGTTAFFHLGDMAEMASTKEIFENPQDPRTKDYVAGAFG